MPDAGQSRDPLPRFTALEAQALATAVGYAVWLLVGQPFSLSAATAYRYMRNVDEWVWALAFLTGASIHLLGIKSEIVRVRQVGLMILALIQAVMCLCVLFANPRLPGIWTHAVLAGGAAYSAIRIRR